MTRTATDHAMRAARGPRPTLFQRVKARLARPNRLQARLLDLLEESVAPMSTLELIYAYHAAWGSEPSTAGVFAALQHQRERCAVEREIDAGVKTIRGHFHPWAYRWSPTDRGFDILLANLHLVGRRTFMEQTALGLA